MKLTRKARLGIAGTVIAASFALTVSACTNDEYTQRKEQQSTTTLKGTSLEQVNLKKKLDLENSPSRIGYVTLLSHAGTPLGYYVIKGKVSNSGSQLGPEQEIICRTSASESCQPVDSKQDDGTYGAGDPGIFFFTVNGVYVETDALHIYSAQPLDIPGLRNLEKGR